MTGIGANSEAVLVVAPGGRETVLITGVLARAAIPCELVPAIDQLLPRLPEEAALVVVPEEALTRDAEARLLAVLKQQSAWSDLPLILITAKGRSPDYIRQQALLRKELGNVTLLARPIRAVTLVSTVESALRARRRQYELRRHVEDQHRAHDALRQAEKLAVAGRLAASIAHEINNPLEAVTNLLYLITRCSDLPRIKDYVQLAQEELARVSHITLQALRFHRESSVAVNTDVGELLDSVLTLYAGRLSSAHIKVDRRYTEGVMLTCYPGDLRQLFANLIGNAVDAMRSGGILKLRLHPATAFNGHDCSGVRVLVADTGHGIAPAHRSRLFEPFFTTKGVTGTGLGLWVSREIVQRHGGSIRVKSRVGGQGSGTVFTIVLRPPNPAPDENTEEIIG